MISQTSIKYTAMKKVLLYLILSVFACSCSVLNLKKEGLSQKQKKYNKTFCKKGTEKVKIYKFKLVMISIFGHRVVEIDTNGDGVMDMLATADKGKFKGLNEKELPCTAVMTKMPNVGRIHHPLSKKQVCMFDIESFEVEGETKLFRRRK